MPKRQPFNRDAPLQTFPYAAMLTGLSISELRAGCKEGIYPFVKSGNTYKVHVPETLEIIKRRALTNCGK